MSTVQGICDPAFETIKTLLQNNINSGEETGAAITINVDGKTVVDIWGGYTDESRSKPWEDNTIVNVWSSTKNITSLAALILHDRGLIDVVNDPVAKYWPEFAANGKENVKIRHLMSHTSGVPGWETPITREQMCDVRYSTDALAPQAPWWEPGTASGYHSATFGHLIGEVIRRTTGKSLTQFVADEIAGPLGADFQIGAKESDWDRIAPVIPPPPLPFDLESLPHDSITYKVFAIPPPDARPANTPMWRNGEVGAANGHGNARSLNHILSAITLGGSVDGKKLLSQKTIDLIFQEQSDGVDLVMMQAIRFGIGYGLCGGGSEESVAFMPKGKDKKACWWGGWGGSWEVMDLDKRVTASYVMNKMGPGTTGSPRTAEYFQALYQILDKQ